MVSFDAGEAGGAPMGNAVDRVEHVLSVHNLLGEGPVWDTQERVIYWTDIEGRAYSRYLPQLDQMERVEVGARVGAFALRAGGGLVMATDRGFAFWDPQGRQLTPLADPEAGRPNMRFNDGKVDPRGRFWAGTMTEDESQYAAGPASLYRLDPDLSVHRMDTGYAIANGLGWSPDERTMYVTDSPRRAIYAYDYDAATGVIANRRQLISTDGESGVPDGLAVDADGFIWSARWGAGKVVRYDPAGAKEREVRLPVQYTTSCCFGGANLDALYVTSASQPVPPEKRAGQPLAGDLFRVGVGATGLPMMRFGG
jgi:sugar lactone lactonase YvrE